MLSENDVVRTVPFLQPALRELFANRTPPARATRCKGALEMKAELTSLRHAVAARRTVVALFAFAIGCGESPAQSAPPPPIWTVPEVGALPDDAHGRLVRRGRDLVTATYAHIGPEVADPAKRFAGNNLACGNCHLNAGSKMLGIPLFGLLGQFPQYSARSGAEISLEQRLNSCMVRSMNGRPLPEDAPEMQGLVAYIAFLSTGVPPGQTLPGLGVGRMPELDRAADPVRGRQLYGSNCAGCHAPDGRGVRRSLPTTDLGYMMPPLWGGDSFNDGAGMARLITAANFIHFNMPHGADYFESAAHAGAILGHRGLHDLAAASAQGGPCRGFSRSPAEARRCAVRAVRRRFQRRAAQIRPVRTDQSRHRAPCGGKGRRAAVMFRAVLAYAPARSSGAAIRLDPVPDHRCDVGAAEFLMARMPVGEVTLISVR